MTIVRYGQPWSLLNQLHRELLTPAVDIKEDADKFVIVAEIPGVKPEAIEVSMEAGVLTVKGQKNAGEKSENQAYQCVDCTFGLFYRRFSLPNCADGTAIKAKSKHGVLEIVIPKKEEALEIKQINVTLEQ